MKELSGELVAADLKIALVVSRFNDFLTKQLLAGATDCFVRHGGQDDGMTVVWVPGSNETPMAARRLAASGAYDAVVALGVVIVGETPHAELINSQVQRSLSAMSLELGLPVINGVVAAHNLEQAIERCGTKAGNRGWNAVLAAVEMANLFRKLGS